MARPIQPTPPVTGEDAERIRAQVEQTPAPGEVARQVAGAKTFLADITRPKRAPWSDKHRSEALRYLFETLAKMAGEGERIEKIDEIAEGAQRENWFRRALDELGLTPSAVRRAVRIVRARAEGHEEVTVRWVVRRAGEPDDGFGECDGEAHASAKRIGGTVVRITMRHYLPAPVEQAKPGPAPTAFSRFLDRTDPNRANGNG